MSLPMSYTMMSMFKKCPLQFKMVYLDKLPRIQIETSALQIGKTVHEILEETINTIKAFPSKSITKVFEDVTTQKLMNSDLAPEVQTEILEIIKNINVDLLTTLKNVDYHSELQVALDENLQPCDFNDSKAVFRGIFDFVWFEEFFNTKTVHVLDFKTNKMQNADELQLFYYAFLAKHYFGLSDNDVVNVYFWYVRFDTKDAFSTWKINVSDIKDDDFVDMYKKLMDSDEYSAVPGTHCNWCSVAVHCPYVKQASPEVVEEKIENDEQEALIDMYLPLKRALNLIEEYIQQKIQDVDELEGKNVRIVKKTYNKTILDEESIRQMLIDAQIPSETLLNAVNITKTLLNKLNIDLPQEFVHTEKVAKITFEDKEE